MMEYDVERWYPSISDFTFRTEFMDLSMIESEAITKMWKFLTHSNSNGPKPDDYDSVLSKLEQYVYISSHLTKILLD